MSARLAAAGAWLAAIAIALVVYRRLRRGRNVVLTGRLAPAIARRVAIVLVLLGLGGERAAAQQPGSGAPARGRAGAAAQEPTAAMPERVTSVTVAQWIEKQQPESEWRRFKLETTRQLLGGDGAEPRRGFSRAFASLLPAAGRPWGSAPTSSAAQALQMLDEMESSGVYDVWLAALLWRAVGPATPAEAGQLARLYARLHEHARIANALVAAQAQMKPVLLMPPGWLSKGGPPRREMEEFRRRTGELLEIAKARYTQTDAGTWLRDGSVQLALAKGSRAPTLVRPDGSEPMATRRPFRIGRLDLIATAKEAGSVLEHPEFGSVVIPEDRFIGVHEMPELLSSAGLAAVRAAVAAALAGDDGAALRIERALPLAHRELRTSLARQPEAPGAPRLRLILALFDDLPTPAEAEPGKPRGQGR